MKELNIREEQEISFQILKEIKNICLRNNIKYYLGYGTLIGAVRHNGFIPWDDDVDIWVNIKDIEELFRLIREETDYQILNHLEDVHWIRGFSKIYDPRTLIIDNFSDAFRRANRGISVDVFPLFEIPDNEAERNKIISTYKKMRIIYLSQEGYYKSVIKDTFCKFASFIGKNASYYNKKLYDLEKKQYNSGLIGCITSPYFSNDIHKNEEFGDMELSFEGEMFSVPSGYDTILRRIYGDYMTLPPAEKRKHTHDSKAYYIGDSND